LIIREINITNIMSEIRNNLPQNVYRDAYLMAKRIAVIAVLHNDMRNFRVRADGGAIKEKHPCVMGLALY
jgi:hypothetical protein